MKKFTLLAIAALLSVVAFAQKRNLSVADAKQFTKEAVQQPSQMKAMKGLSTQQQSFARKVAAKKAPMKVASVDELVGSYVSISTQYEYDSDAKELYVSDVPNNGVATTITKIDENTIGITGLVTGAKNAIEATVDLENGTISFEAGQTLFTSATYGPILMAMADDAEVFTGTIYEDGIVIDQLWCDLLGGESEYAGYLWSGYYFSTFLARPNGTMSWSETSSTDNTTTDNTTTVFIYQDEEEHVASVFNFADYGFVVDIDLLEDEAFSISKQLVEQGGQTYGDFYFYGLDNTESSLINEVKSKGTKTELTYDGKWTFYSTNEYWYGVHTGLTITLTDGSEFAYPVIPDVAATPADPSVIYLSEYNADNGYGAVYMDIPTKDVDGNLIKTSKLYYQLYSDINGTIAPITLTADLYKNLDEDMTEVPYDFVDDYDFDVFQGYKRVFLNFDYTNYNFIGVKSIYYGGDVRNETEIQWLDIEAMRAEEALAEAKDALEEEIEAAEELREQDYLTEGTEDFDAAIADAKAVLEDETATINEVNAAIVALQQAETAFLKVNPTRKPMWIAEDVYEDVEVSQEVTDITIDENISGLFDKATGSTAPQYYANGKAVRFYKNNTLTISANANVEKITKIQFAYTQSSYSKATTASIGTYASSGAVGVWEGEAKDVTFTVTGSGHSRIQGIVVTYVLTSDAVGIKTVETVTIPVAGIYNLQGQRVEKAVKGLYIIDGKKVVVK